VSTASYLPPLDKLLTLGDARPTLRRWPDYSHTGYSQYGLAPEHVPDLIRMATDEELYQANSQSSEVWAPVHAWRALGQLRAGSAAEPLTHLFHLIDDNHDEMISDELPQVFGLIGAGAIPALTAYLEDVSHGPYARHASSRGLLEIARRQPEARAECVAIITRQLERYAENDEALNAFLIGTLLDLKAVESAPVMERAFAAGRVELAVAGDWEEVQIELGLKQKRDTPARNYVAESLCPELGAKLKVKAERVQVVEPPPPPRKSKAKKRDKRKQQEPRGKKKRK